VKRPVPGEPEPVPPGLEEDVAAFRRIVQDDPATNGRCVTCGYQRAAFVIASGFYIGRFIGVCPRCAFERLHQYRNDVPVAPSWVVWLQGELVREIRGQAGKDGREPTGLWTTFYKCARCGTLILEEAASWFAPFEQLSSPAYCPDCVAVVRGDGLKDVGKWVA